MSLNKAAPRQPSSRRLQPLPLGVKLHGGAQAQADTQQQHLLHVCCSSAALDQAGQAPSDHGGSTHAQAAHHFLDPRCRRVVAVQRGAGLVRRRHHNLRWGKAQVALSTGRWLSALAGNHSREPRHNTQPKSRGRVACCPSQRQQPGCPPPRPKQPTQPPHWHPRAHLVQHYYPLAVPAARQRLG